MGIAAMSRVITGDNFPTGPRGMTNMLSQFTEAFGCPETAMFEVHESVVVHALGPNLPARA
jgi:hypothetical protein